MIGSIMGGLSAGAGLLSGIMGNNQAQRQLEYQYRMHQEQMQLQMALAQMAQGRQDEENAYQRRWEDFNRWQAGQERDFALGELRDYQDRLLGERQYEIDRQVEMDREAARQQAFQLEQYLEQKGLAREEREWAQQQLEYVKQVAAGEREEDIRRFYEDRITADAERDWYIQQYMSAQSQAYDERAYDMAYRDRMLETVDGTRAGLQQMLEALGAAPELDTLTREDFEAETQRRQDLYQSDVDRAAQAVASANEADLMRSGLDESTVGTDRRGQIAERLSHEYQNARARAYNDALSYVSGQSEAIGSSAAREMQQRAAMLGEMSGVNAYGLEAMMGMPQISSAMSPYGMVAGSPTAILDRNLASAGNFMAPVPIGSQIVGGFDGGSRLSGYQVGPSAASPLGMQLQSSIFHPYSMTLQNPATYYQNALAGQASMFDYAARQANQAGANMGAAGMQFGSSLADLFGNIGNSSWFGNLFGSSSAPMNSPLPPIKPRG